MRASPCPQNKVNVALRGCYDGADNMRIIFPTSNLNKTRCYKNCSKSLKVSDCFAVYTFILNFTSDHAKGEIS